VFSWWLACSVFAAVSLKSENASAAAVADPRRMWRMALSVIPKPAALAAKELVSVLSSARPAVDLPTKKVLVAAVAEAADTPREVVMAAVDAVVTQRLPSDTLWSHLMIASAAAAVSLPLMLLREF